MMQPDYMQLGDPPTPSRTDVLVISESGLWPMDRAVRVQGCGLIRALSEAGMKIAVSTLRPTQDAPFWLTGLLHPWPEAQPTHVRELIESWGGVCGSLRRTLIRSQAIDAPAIAGLLPLVDELRPRAVIALGQHGPVLLKGLSTTHPAVKRVWCTGEEPASYLIQCLLRDPAALWRLRASLICQFAGIEWLFARGLDAILAPDRGEARKLRIMTGVKQAVTLRHGVDATVFKPEAARTTPRSLVFRGRLDIEPNVHGLRWFTQHVWPSLRSRSHTATLRIIGRNPLPSIRELGAIPGVRVMGGADEAHQHVREASAAILPQRFGGGVQHTLLEAAAMGLPILASPAATKGLDLLTDSSPLVLCHRPAEWVESVWRLWNDPSLAADLSRAGRSWVTRSHTWEDAATRVIALLNQVLPRDQRITTTSAPPLQTIGGKKRDEQASLGEAA